MLLFNKGYDLLFILRGACLLMVKVIHHINNIIDNILYPIGNRRSLRVFYILSLVCIIHMYGYVYVYRINDRN